MTASDAAQFLSQVVIASTIVLALINFVRERNASNRDVFLFFLALGASSMLSLLEHLVAIPEPLDEAASVSLIVHPFLVVRVLYHMRAVPRFMVFPAFIGAVASVAWFLLVRSEEPGGVGLVLVILYIAGFDIYAGYAMLRGGLRRSGLSAFRMRLGAAGLALVGVVMLQLGLTVSIPAIEDISSVVIQVTALTCVLVLFFGFAPPRWLARTALRNAAARFAQQRAMGVVQQRDVDSVLNALVEWASQVTGGWRACLARWDPEAKRFLPKDGDTSWLQGRTLGPDDAWAWQVWETGESRLADIRELDADLREALHRRNVTNLYLVAVPADSGVGGLLIVPLIGRPLFPASEMSLLALLAQLTVMELGYAFMREQQDRLINELSVVNQQLLDSNRELESFSYTVSHDLRAPLRAINGFIGMVLAEQPGLSSESARRLNVARQNAGKLGDLIDGLLAFSRLGRQSVEYQPVKLGTVVQEAVDELMATVPPGRDVSVRVSPAIPDCSGDPLLIKQVFTNLLNNALKFTTTREHGRVSVDVVASHRPDQVTLRVKDNGIGFDMRYADKIFGVFERVHDPNEYDGTGIGLALVHRIVSRHGGMVWASAMPGQGASFYVALPAAVPSPNNAPDDAQPESGELAQMLYSATKDQGEAL